jgi:hypothetical protein
MTIRIHAEPLFSAGWMRFLIANATIRNALSRTRGGGEVARAFGDRGRTVVLGMLASSGVEIATPTQNDDA